MIFEYEYFKAFRKKKEEKIKSAVSELLIWNPSLTFFYVANKTIHTTAYCREHFRAVYVTENFVKVCGGMCRSLTLLT